MQSRPVKSALRTLEVLELFMEHRRPMRLKEIYQALNYPQSSTTYLLKSMLNRGYLNYNRRDHTYLPTVQVTSLGNWLSGYIYTDDTYQNLVRELQKATDETVGLASQNDLFIQYILLESPDHEFKFTPALGTMRSMVDSSSGLALMSKMNDDAIEKICRYTNYYKISEQPVSITEVMDRVQLVRETGYAYLKNKPTRKVSAISIALDETLHNVPLAIGVGGFADRIETEKDTIVALMKEAIAKTW
ncbi:helix-turn-helix domain-containing protein [Aestuariicella hydrocarbonica]|uniref:Helix-turn-helix domain-containing protein n=1 Tax=Pseudomaricurvus hydrocarbonicus TaxID=1470433 RepID=A0A9E5JSR2_9GAMM|nr:helix-turn-helix domain-containing protein [Aestuariicella hydrocarbonica]NHO66147.1 helix-turn-helix domain-containing protein [Aestuariicella hydrocarbonica]